MLLCKLKKVLRVITRNVITPGNPKNNSMEFEISDVTRTTKLSTIGNGNI